MSIVPNKSAFVQQGATPIGLAEMFTETAAAANPPYLVLSVLDRDEYTAGANFTTGSLSGNGRTLKLSGIGGDGRGTGLVFAYQPSSGRYYNSTYGYFDQMIYHASGSSGDVTNLSLFGTNNLSQAKTYATNAYSMMQVDANGFLGSATVVTQPTFRAAVPDQATPNSLAAVARDFVGQAWNMNGCWVLASTIAAEAGASLPVQSSAIGIPGQANGEWIVAFNGPEGQLGDWQSLVQAGEIVVIGTPGGGGHITTCVSGSGISAMLVDNATFVTSSGNVTNLANDGSSSDIIVHAPHAASQEWAGVSAASVVIYELDTPIVKTTVSSANLAFNTAMSLGSLFTTTDPANKTIVQWQVYDTASGDFLVYNGTNYSDHSMASSLTVTSLSSVSLLTGSVATTDVLEVRAYNGSWWGDWTSLTVTVGPTIPSPPVLMAPTPDQTWTSGHALSLAMAFSDPQGQTLAYSAKLANGKGLPSWLVVDAATGTLSGTPSPAAQDLNIVVTATDTSGLTTSDAFSALVLGVPIFAMQTPAQVWIEGKPIALALSRNTFIDPQGQSLVYTATLSNGQALPAWLTFNADSETFSGTSPSTPQSLGIKVTATNTSGLAISEKFTAAVQAPPLPIPPIALSAQTPNQTWITGKSADLILPAKTFTDALGLKMSFAAYQVSGPNATSWLRFNSTTNEISGNVPASMSGTIGLVVIASDAQHATARDMFSVSFIAGSTHVTSTAVLTFAGSLAPSASMFGMLALHS